ncbi:hypothetical protein C4D60_Mb04t27560 [Musa balbisiana]|uniref:Uncharacterized protein n=1 Tax=Musa balbisiana TaxID=52838 RepID=A0A4S8KF24_MUSBA|nr:hypothetical protein C4D60_Mb04t27560 [Musa balbisiana]
MPTIVHSWPSNCVFFRSRSRPFPHHLDGLLLCQLEQRLAARKHLCSLPSSLLLISLVGGVGHLPHRCRGFYVASVVRPSSSHLSLSSIWHDMPKTEKGERQEKLSRNKAWLNGLESIKKRFKAQIMEGASFWIIVIPSGGARLNGLESIKKRFKAQIMEGASFWIIVIPSGGARVLPEHKLKQEPNSSDLFEP